MAAGHRGAACRCTAASTGSATAHRAPRPPTWPPYGPAAPRAFLGGPAAAFNFGLVEGDAPAARGHRTRPNGASRAWSATGARRSTGRTRRVWRGIPTLTVPAHAGRPGRRRCPIDDLARACHEAGVRYRTTPRQVDRGARRGRPNATGRGQARERIMSGEAQGQPQPAGVALPASCCARSACRCPTRTGQRWAAGGLPLAGAPPDRGAGRLSASTTPGYSWEQDHRREREAYARGDQFRRYTWGDVFEAPRGDADRAVLPSTRRSRAKGRTAPNRASS